MTTFRLVIIPILFFLAGMNFGLLIINLIKQCYKLMWMAILFGIVVPVSVGIWSIFELL